VSEYSKARQTLGVLRQRAANAKVQGREPQEIPATLADLIELYEILAVQQSHDSKVDEDRSGLFGYQGSP
jgi:hypothetical protein